MARTAISMLASGVLLSACLLERGGSQLGEDPAATSSSGGGGLTVGVGGATSSSATTTSSAGGAASSSSVTTGQGGSGGGGGNPLGNGVIDDGEECDDGNLVDGDGCDPLGQLEAGWNCPQPNSPCLHVSGFDSSAVMSGGTIGAVGGSGYTRPCPAGQVFVGVHAYDTSNCSCSSPSGNLASFVPICADVSVDAAGNFSWAMPTVDLTEVGGGLGQGAFLGDLFCSNDRYAIGIRGRDNPMDYGELETIQIRCARFAFVTSPAGGQIARSGGNNTNALGGGGPDENAVCAGDRVMVGVDGYQGAVVDQVDVQCAEATPTYCGDGNLDRHEGCDDGNTVAGDGCDTLCQIE